MWRPGRPFRPPYNPGSNRPSYGNLRYRNGFYNGYWSGFGYGFFPDSLIYDGYDPYAGVNDDDGYGGGYDNSGGGFDNSYVGQEPDASNDYDNPSSEEPLPGTESQSFSLPPDGRDQDPRFNQGSSAGGPPVPYEDRGTSQLSNQIPGLSYPPSSGRPDFEPETVTLVFKDGRPREIIHNYILTRATLTVLDEKRVQIPVDQLDLAATVKVNRQVGVEFRLPGNSK